MNGLLVYGSFHNTAAEYAQLIAEKLSLKAKKCNEVTLADIENASYIIIGSGVQKFNFHPTVNFLFKKFEDILSTKTLFLYVTSYDPTIQNKILAKCDKKIQSAVKVSMSLGGRIKWDELPFGEKIVITLISTILRVKLKNFDTTSNERMEKFISKCKKHLIE